MPDPEWGETVCALIQLAEGGTESEAFAQELTSFVRGRLDSYKCPRRILFRDRLPRTETGKLLKRQLRKEVPDDRMEQQPWRREA
jgi:long-chain acyl-CoA synthetase